MSETRSDKIQDQRDQLAAALRYILANNSEVKGRAIAETALLDVPGASLPSQVNIMQMALDAQATSVMDTEQDAYARKRGFNSIDEYLDGRRDR